MNFAQTLADQFSLQTWQTEKVIELIDEGNTIPLSPATARRRTAASTTRRSASSLSASSTCAASRSGARRCAA